MPLVCYDLLNNLAISINQSSNKQGKMVGYKDAPDAAKKAA